VYTDYNTIIVYTVYDPKSYNEAINSSHSPFVITRWKIEKHLMLTEIRNDRTVGVFGEKTASHAFVHINYLWGYEVVDNERNQRKYHLTEEVL